jgi:spore maturation protein CgeB
MLVTDGKRNLPEMWETGREVIAYETTDDAINQIRYYLDHEDERQAIAEAGQQRTLRDHTFAQRAAQLDEMICGLMSGRSRVTYFAAG